MAAAATADAALWTLVGLIDGLHLLGLGLDPPVSGAHFLAASLLCYGVCGALFGAGAGVIAALGARPGSGRSGWGLGSHLASAIIRGALLLLALAELRGGTALGAIVALAAFAGLLAVAPLALRARRSAMATALILLAAAALRALPVERARGSAPRVILITIDTLRADALGAYGALQARTPNLDRLAAESVRFERAFACAPFTIPSLTSMMSGVRVDRHGVRSNHHPLDPDLFRVGDALAEAGVDLVAATDLDLADRVGLDRGFQRRLHHELSIIEHPPLRQALSGWEALGAWFDSADSSLPTTLRVRRWIRREADPAAPFLLWFHYYDDAPHAPYDAPRPYRPDASAGPVSLAELERLAAAEAPPSAGVRQRLMTHYSAEVAWLDAQIGLLWQALEERGLWDRSWIMVAADHGEQFGRDGVFQHGASLRHAVLRIPLMIKPPRGAAAPLLAGVAAPGVTRELVSGVDLAPTLLEIFGLAEARPELRRMDGRSLLEDRVAGDEERVAWAETPALASPPLDGGAGRSPALALLRADGWKLVVDPASGSRALFDLRRDPGEARDLAASRPGLADSFAAHLLEPPWQPPPPPPPDEPLRRGLEALGYVGPD